MESIVILIAFGKDQSLQSILKEKLFLAAMLAFCFYSNFLGEENILKLVTTLIG